MKEIEALSENDFKFNKKFGQNFIFDKNLLNAIINDSGISKDDEVLEIGPGAGTLTKVIAERAKMVVSYEIDDSLKPILAKNLAGVGNSKIVFKDALKANINDIESHFGGKYTIVANLPYYITTPLIFKFVKETKRVSSMCIMVQKEVGERLVAQKDDREYGAISVVLGFYGDVCILRQVPRRMFVPSPNVDSCVVQINFIDKKFNCDNTLFEKVVKSAFSNRRKTLANNLSKDFNVSKQKIGELLECNGFSATVRGDSLGVEEFVKLTNLLQTIISG